MNQSAKLLILQMTFLRWQPLHLDEGAVGMGAKHQEAIGQAYRFSDMVRRNHQGAQRTLLSSPEPQQFIPEPKRRQGITRPKWLIQQEHFWFGCQCTCQTDALAHAFWKVARSHLREVVYVQSLHRRKRALSPLEVGPRICRQGQFYLLQDRQPGKEGD